MLHRKYLNYIHTEHYLFYHPHQASYELIIENNKERIYNKTVNEFSLPDYLIIRNFLIALLILFPVTFLFQRDISMTALFLTGFVVNEMIHVALAYFQAI